MNTAAQLNNDLEDKNRILNENPHLLQMYKDLVITGVLTSDEFWDIHAKQYTQQQNEKQDIGVSAAFLADIKPQTDGCNGLKYNLTADVIACIFKTYPAVKKKHFEYVPAKMSESEFWTKFFQSHYFHRDRMMGASKDIFTKCRKIDDKALQEAVTKSAGDVLLDLRQFEDNSLEEGFGGAVSDKNGVNSGNIVHQNIIYRINQHSTMVLSTCQKIIEQSSNNNRPSSDIESKKRARIMAKIRLDDLATDAYTEPTTSELSLLKIERYLHGPIPDFPNTSDNSNDNLSNMEVTQAQILKLTETWCNQISEEFLINPEAALNASGELTPGGALMRGFQEQSQSQLVPPSIEEEVRNLYLALSVLLRQFWHSFPPTTPELEAKVIRMHEAIQRFAAVKLVPFEENVMRDASPIGSSITQHLNQLIRTAAQKFNIWHEPKTDLINE